MRKGWQHSAMLRRLPQRQGVGLILRAARAPEAGRKGCHVNAPRGRPLGGPPQATASVAVSCRTGDQSCRTVSWCQVTQSSYTVGCFTVFQGKGSYGSSRDATLRCASPH